MSIGATQNGITSNAATMTVTPPPAPPTLASISVTPNNPSLEESQTQQFSATGAFSDGSTGDLTASATWSSSDNAVATINAAGLANAVQAGTVSIEATQDGITSNAATLTVTPPAPPPPTPQGSVAISGPTSLNRGDNVTFTVTVTNTGSSTLSDAQLTFNVAPNDLLKDLSPGTSISNGSISPDATASQTWSARGDNEGSGTITASAASNGTNLDTTTQPLTVFK